MNQVISIDPASAPPLVGWRAAGPRPGSVLLNLQMRIIMSMCVVKISVERDRDGNEMDKK